MKYFLIRFLHAVNGNFVPSSCLKLTTRVAYSDSLLELENKKSGGAQVKLLIISTADSLTPTEMEVGNYYLLLLHPVWMSFNRVTITFQICKGTGRGAGMDKRRLLTLMELIHWGWTWTIHHYDAIIKVSHLILIK